MIGIRKLPSVAGTDGTRNRKTMMTPCMVKNLLYVSDGTRSGCGVSSSRRIRPAKAPPMKKKNVIEIRYSIAMRLWSPVNSQLRRPSSAVLKFFLGTSAVLWSGRLRTVVVVLPLMGRHERGISRLNMLRRIENLVTQVRIVHQHLRAVSQHQLRPVDTCEIWPACGGVAGVAGITTHAGEEAFAILRKRHAAGRLLRPLLVIRRRESGDGADHGRMICAAVLRAEEVILAGGRGFEPHRAVATGNHLALDAEVGDGEAVEDVLRDHGQLHGLSDGDMQGVNLVLSAGMLGLPHPLFPNDVDVHGIDRRIVDPEIEQRAPDEAHQKDRERNDRPCCLEQRRSFDLGGDRMHRLAIADRERYQDRADQEEPEERHGQEEEIQCVHVGRDGRRLARNELGGVEPLHQKLPQYRTNSHRSPFSSSSDRLLVRSWSRPSRKSRRNITNMKLPRLTTVTMPPNWTIRATISECLLVCGS